MTAKTTYAPGFRLDGKVALVTGASRGIGYGLACALAEVGEIGMRRDLGAASFKRSRRNVVI
jgi:NAD(P)-dependent dehydrogenase (short-subunit alcohol dehydrogenase family)